jgi:hypothetical protein
LEIGSYDAGDFSLSNPSTFSVSPDGKLFVLDENLIVLFDQFGTGLNKLNAGFAAENINITFNNLVINDSNKIKFMDLSAAPLILKEFLPDKELLNAGIVEALLFELDLYILTKNNIVIFNRS